MRMKLSKRRCTDRWSKCTSYSQYTALIESNLVLLRVLAVLAVPVRAVATGRSTASTQSTRFPPPPKVSCFNSHSWDYPSTVNAVCNKMRMELSKRRCIDGRNILYTPSILRLLKIFWYYSEYSQYVGRTHTIVRLQTRIRRKDRTENFGGFVYVLDLYNGNLCCGFLCARLILVSLFRLPRRGLPRPTDTPRAITPRAITPLPPLHGYHAWVYIPAITP